MKRLVLFVLVFCLALAPTTIFSTTCTAQDTKTRVEKKNKKKKAKEQAPQKKQANAPFTGDRPSVDVAVLLDTSNSMDGLINQAKSQLWNIVGEFAKAKKKGKTPQLRVSVFEYGNSKLPAREGYIRQVVQLTDDLDKVSEALFGLTTKGGDEYCGMVIDEAIGRLDWSSEPNAYKAIFIAGNEPFTQGSVDYQAACKKAIGDGIVVNTIHCGDYSQGVKGKWQHGAQLAEGEYLNIDQDQKVVHIKCPQDELILKLNLELNKTYLWFGKKPTRFEFKSNQSTQDFNAISSGSISTRALAKAGAIYSNRGRDLVDTYAGNLEALDQVDESELPDEMQKMDLQARIEYVRTMAEKRKEIKTKMAELAKQRVEFVRAEQAKQPQASEEATLADAFAEAVEDQLEESGFELERE